MNEIKQKLNELLLANNDWNFEHLAQVFAPNHFKTCVIENSKIEINLIQNELNLVVSFDSRHFFKTSLGVIKKNISKNKLAFNNSKFSFVIKSMNDSNSFYTTTLIQAVPFVAISTKLKTNCTLFIATEIGHFLDFDEAERSLKEIDIIDALNIKTHFVLNKSTNSILTKREIEILKQISKGNSYKQIADLLFISPNTVNKHKENILKKFPGKGITQIVNHCIAQGIITLNY